MIAAKSRIEQRIEIRTQVKCDFSHRYRNHFDRYLDYWRESDFAIFRCSRMTGIAVAIAALNFGS